MRAGGRCKCAAQPPGAIRLAIADSHAIFRQGLRVVVEPLPDVVVVAELERLDEVGPMLARRACDVLLLDLDLLMEATSPAGISTLPCSDIGVVVLSAKEAPEHELAAVQAGARAVVSKRASVESLLRAIRAVAAGDAWFPPTLLTQLLSEGKLPGERLSPREREIVYWVALGDRNAEAAARLSISQNTIKKHLNTIYQKLSVRDRAELVLRAIQLGIICVPNHNGSLFDTTKVGSGLEPK